MHILYAASYDGADACVASGVASLPYYLLQNGAADALNETTTRRSRRSNERVTLALNEGWYQHRDGGGERHYEAAMLLPTAYRSYGVAATGGLVG